MGKKKRYERLANKAIGHCKANHGDCDNCPLSMGTCYHLFGFVSVCYLNRRRVVKALKGVYKNQYEFNIDDLLDI